VHLEIGIIDPARLLAANAAAAYLPVFIGEATISFAAVMLVHRSGALADIVRRHTEFGRLRFS
jgi:hypothetical protein